MLPRSNIGVSTLGSSLQLLRSRESKKFFLCVVESRHVFCLLLSTPSWTLISELVSSTNELASYSVKGFDVELQAVALNLDAAKLLKAGLYERYVEFIPCYCVI